MNTWRSRRRDFRRRRRRRQDKRDPGWRAVSIGLWWVCHWLAWVARRAALLVLLLAGCTVKHVHEVRPAIMRCGYEFNGFRRELVCRWEPARSKR